MQQGLVGDMNVFCLHRKSQEHEQTEKWQNYLHVGPHQSRPPQNSMEGNVLSPAAERDNTLPRNRFTETWRSTYEQTNRGMERSGWTNKQANSLDWIGLDWIGWSRIHNSSIFKLQTTWWVRGFGLCSGATQPLASSRFTDSYASTNGARVAELKILHISTWAFI